MERRTSHDIFCRGSSRLHFDHNDKTPSLTSVPRSAIASITDQYVSTYNPDIHSESIVHQSPLPRPSREIEHCSFDMGSAVIFFPKKNGEFSPVQESLAGLTVAFSLLSKTVACSFMVGVSPLVGLWSSVVMGVTAPLRAQDGVIFGTAAVVVVPLSALTQSSGVEYMAPCVFISAVMQGFCGIFRVAKMVDHVSAQVLSGFLNALGLILLLSQASVFHAAAASGGAVGLVSAVSVSALCVAIIQILPRLTKALPSSLVGLVITTILGSYLALPLETLLSSSSEGTFSGGLSSLPRLVDFIVLRDQVTSPDVLMHVMPAAMSIMTIALVETLLAGKIVDETTRNPNIAGIKAHDVMELNDDGRVSDCDVSSRSVLAMSAGNALSALLGGFGGCGLIPQTVLNLKSGGGGRFSSISYPIAAASCIVFFAPLVGKISLAALSGVMITIAIDTVAWEFTFNAIRAVIKPTDYPDENGLALSRTQRLIDFVALGVSSTLCFFGNLAVGIVVAVSIQKVLLSLYESLVDKYCIKPAAVRE